MITAEEARTLVGHLTPEELEELDALILADQAEVRWRPLPGPQTMAYESKADIVGYGGAAGGGKTDLIAGLTETRHKRCLVARREKAQTEGVIQRLVEIRGDSDGLNSQKGIWQTEHGLIEFAGLDNPGDERRWQGRPHDLKAFDEVTEQREAQVRFVMGWNRTNDPSVPPKTLMTFNPPTTTEGRWVIGFFGPWLDKGHALYPTPPGELRYCAMLPDAEGTSKDMWVDSEGKPLTGAPFVLVDGKVTYDFDPADFKPEDVIQPKSRTFIPARLTDNPYYMATGYMAQLQALPEPLRSQMLYGSFTAGVTDDPWQVVPTAWVEAAQARWTERRPRGEMLTIGVDVARGGKDKTVLSTRHKTPDSDWWFDRLKVHAGQDTPDGPKVAGLVIGERRDEATILLDVIGVGASPYDVLNGMDLDIYGINVSEKATAKDRSGKLSFFNLRSQLVWKFRELLDPAHDTGVALPPDPQLLKELCAFKWSLSGMTIKVNSREDIVEDTGVSPDRASAVILAAMDVPKRAAYRAASNTSDAVLNHDPYARL
jgi:hypothetical protein